MARVWRREVRGARGSSSGLSLWHTHMLAHLSAFCRWSRSCPTSTPVRGCWRGCTPTSRTRWVVSERDRDQSVINFCLNGAKRQRNSELFTHREKIPLWEETWSRSTLSRPLICFDRLGWKKKIWCMEKKCISMNPRIPQNLKVVCALMKWSCWDRGPSKSDFFCLYTSPDVTFRVMWQVHFKWKWHDIFCQ